MKLLEIALGKGGQGGKFDGRAGGPPSPRRPSLQAPFCSWKGSGRTQGGSAARNSSRFLTIKEFFFQVRMGGRGPSQIKGRGPADPAKEKTAHRGGFFRKPAERGIGQGRWNAFLY